MHDFEILYADIELNDLLSSINETDTKIFTVCHGSYHANFIANRVAEILIGLNFDERTIEIGKIAGLIHDIGCISGKKGHALKSAQMCAKFLSKINVTQLEKNLIVQAIADHSNGNNIKSAIGAALLIADKTDLSKKRVLNPNDVNNYHKNLLEVDNVEITVQAKEMLINFVASDKFSITALYELWSKAFTIPAKAAKYFNLSAVFAVNNLRVDNIYE
ncbi:MAG: hypothetical protein FWG65_05840 [Turicibacter sp.]|nr:hypothetical protein [Turicibacter sp.]